MCFLFLYRARFAANESYFVKYIRIVYSDYVRRCLFSQMRVKLVVLNFVLEKLYKPIYGSKTL